jgi:hypothetical protein
MISKDAIRDAVYALLYEDANALLARRDPDAFHGWVPGEPGHWLGQAEEDEARYRVAVAESQYRDAVNDSWSDPDNPAVKARVEAAQARQVEAQEALEQVQRYNQDLLAARRATLIHRLVARLFVRNYRRATRLEWDLYNPAVPDSLRRYVSRQLARGELAPTSMVFLYLILRDTVKHGMDYQTEAITGYDYLVDNPLVRGYLDIDATEDEPSRQRREYIRELQAQAIRDRVFTGHANKDPRDLLADFEYAGLPEQLGAMWIDKTDACPHCSQGVRIRMVHSGKGYRYAKVCPNYREDPQCAYETLSPVLETRKALRDWAAVEFAAARAA